MPTSFLTRNRYSQSSDALLEFLYFQDISQSNIVAFAAQDITVKEIKEIQDYGFPDISPSKIIAFKAMDIDKDYIAYVKEKGFKDLTPSKLIQIKALGL